MQILALDTTTREGSVAVMRDGVLLYQHRGDPRATHGERLPGDIMRALDGAAIGAGDLHLLAVAVGPGSFTGLRVGVAAVQGLALARGLTVVPVPTLEALARAGSLASGESVPPASVSSGEPIPAASTEPIPVASTEPIPVASAFRRKESDAVELIAPWMDGQRGEVFAALYRVLPGDRVLPPKGGSHDGGSHDGGSYEIHPPTAATPAAVLDAWELPPTDAPIVFIGDGAVRYRDLLATRLGSRARILEAPPLAAVIARIALEAPHRAVEPHAIVPIYVRRSDAELARERRRTGAPEVRDAELDKRKP